MAFNTFTFIFFFLSVLFLYNLPFSWRSKKHLLLGSSYLFYAAWNPPFVVLLWISTLIDWWAVKLMAGTKRRSVRHLCLMASLCTNLGLLGFFKYGGFVLENLQNFLATFGIIYQPPEFSIILPMGISFYTFQTLSYTIDVYRRNARPWNDFLDFALYVTFFPQLVAGPIVRSTDFLPQCVEPKRATAKQFGWGLCLLTVGLFEKNVLADNLLAPVVDELFGSDAGKTFLGAWIGTMAFSGQIFFDFAGYSTCGIATALCMGFILPDNFRFPYAAIGFSDFWRRWHISLSSWLRDYLYVPLGGNRHGRFMRYRNLSLTMLIGGLWHGAAWRFVAWGGLHGFYLVIEAALSKYWGHIRLFHTTPVRILLALATYGLVCIAWVFFRAQDFSAAFEMLQAMFGLGPWGYDWTYRSICALAVVFFMLIAHWRLRETDLETLVGKIPTVLLIFGFSILLLAVLLIQGEDRAFIYFQF